MSKINKLICSEIFLENCIYDDSNILDKLKEKLKNESEYTGYLTYE